MREARARAWLQRLLWLYPRSFREVLGDDLVQTTLHRWRDMKQSGAGEVRFWTSEGAHFVVDGAIERMRATRGLPGEAHGAWRQVKRSPAYQALAIGTLALGIGATTIILTIADTVVFRPLPYADAHALYLMHSQLGTLELSGTSLPNLRDLQSSVRSMTWLAGAR